MNKKSIKIAFNLEFYGLVKYKCEESKEFWWINDEEDVCTLQCLKDEDESTHFIQRFYHSDGQLQSFYNYKNYKCHGEYKAYDVCGAVAEEGYYRNGKRHGLLKIYDARSGFVSQIESYRSGELHGECKYYNIDDELICTVIFKNGKKKSIV